MIKAAALFLFLAGSIYAQHSPWNRNFNFIKEQGKHLMPINFVVDNYTKNIDLDSLVNVSNVILSQNDSLKCLLVKNEGILDTLMIEGAGTVDLVYLADSLARKYDSGFIAYITSKDLGNNYGGKFLSDSSYSNNLLGTGSRLRGIIVTKYVGDKTKEVFVHEILHTAGADHTEFRFYLKPVPNIMTPGDTGSDKILDHTYLQVRKYLESK